MQLSDGFCCLFLFLEGCRLTYTIVQKLSAFVYIIFLVHLISKGFEDSKKTDRELFLSVNSRCTISSLIVIVHLLAITSLPDGKLLYVSESLSPLAYAD